jgi:3-oxoacyl-[acyl-carrier protein] reductase
VIGFKRYHASTCKRNDTIESLYYELEDIMDLGLQKKVALVLGASRGLGFASALALAKEGVYVTIGARDNLALTAAAEKMRRETGSRILAIPADVLKAEDLEKIVAGTVEEFGRLDILINNAGGPPAGTFEDFDDNQWERAFELNFLSVVRLIRLSLPHLRKTGSGRIINIVSTSVKEPIGNLILSNSIRPGVIGLAKTLSVELGRDNITINNVCPGRMLTDRTLQGSSIQKKLAEGRSIEEAIKEVVKDIPLGRLGNPEELAALVVFLASEQAGYITGTTIQVDGGLTRALF